MTSLQFTLLQDSIKEDIAARLTHSLSETLVQYYPFSGRLKSSTQLDCNDEGVEFQQVNMEQKMDEFVTQESHSLVFPYGSVWGNVCDNAPLLKIRLVNYICGGVSIAVCMSHKLGDAKSVHTFMTSWARKTREIDSFDSNENRPRPHSPCFISHPWTGDAEIASDFQLFKKDWSVRRFLFPNSKLTKLKELVSQKSGIEKITTFEVLTALLSKCSARANTRSSGFFTPSTLLYAVNMRDRLIPPLPKTSIGNIAWMVDVDINNESEVNLSTLVEKIKSGKMGLGGTKNTEDVTIILSRLAEIKQKNYGMYFCSSLCKMQFYRVDFGWGNPSRVAMADGPMNNSFLLMDTPNEDGIEALVSLNEKSMTAFQEEKDILEFSSSS